MTRDNRESNDEEQDSDESIITNIFKDPINRKRVLADEIQDSIFTKPLPLEYRKEIKAEHTILQTGHNTPIIQYVGRVDEIITIEFEGVERKAFECDDGRLSATFILHDKEKKEFRFIETITPPAYVAITGVITTEEKNGREYSRVIVYSLREVSKQDRIRFLINASNDTLDRVEECDKGQVESEITDEQYYNDTTLESLVYTAKKALERASELSTTEDSELKAGHGHNHQHHIYSLRSQFND